MDLYTLTEEEREIIRQLNESRTNVLLIILDKGEGNIGVDAEALQEEAFSIYLDAIGPFDPEKVVTISGS